MCNRAGLTASISTYGATLTGLKIPATNGQTDVVLGYERLENYVNDKTYSGATVGRTANRISGASFVLGEYSYQLDCNEGQNNLHGGYNGFSYKVWQAEQLENGNEPALRMTLISPDGEGGFPGNLLAQILFTLMENGLRIEYSAVTDKPCPVSMTSHPYFNLRGGRGDLGGYELKIRSSRTLSLGGNLLPDGKLVDVQGTEADFTDFAPMDGMNQDGPVRHDRYYPLDENGSGIPATTVRCPESGLAMEVETSQPGLQFYSGDYIAQGTEGKNGCIYGPRSGFCLEPHGYPDAPNKKQFPSVILNPGETYRHSTEYRFLRI